MLKTIVTLIMYLFIVTPLLAQSSDISDSTYYSQIPDYPRSYTAGSVASRMVDGLGFRFYWATDGLRPEDLQFKPGDDARTVSETVDHIFEMSYLVVNAINKESQYPPSDLSFAQKRLLTLSNLRKASEVIRNSSDKDLEGYAIKFGNGTELPFWNLINGPISDALWHCGQIVSFRRLSGNPFNSYVSLLNGRLRK
ncbi:hypothetical protein LVD17_02195 [Fulvivirga ulvae]|uniref:hypothetical protein n=1 Tax=Fulvivirga ulvae TaxID=2904245 RepID=UPI001F3CD3BA|nr:hypothetical protein [Fulvivirga ulvae]UII32644.1 hypothetical protein LVD17_02195 [Fulvivirga ulvae]